MAPATMTQAEMDQWEADRRAGPWKCFNCGETFTDAKAASGHFRPDDVEDDGAGWPAACVDPLRHDEAERRLVLIEAEQELAAEREAHHQSRQKLAALEAENAKLREALKFYADPDHHADGAFSERLIVDKGRRARALLQGQGGAS